MHKAVSVFCFLSIAASLMAAPTANEDFVVAEDAKTYTNAVDAAKEYTDEKIAAIPAESDPVHSEWLSNPIFYNAAIFRYAFDTNDLKKATSGVGFAVARPSFSKFVSDGIVFSPAAGNENSRYEVFLAFPDKSGTLALKGDIDGKISSAITVKSVNGMTGDVTIAAADVGAVPTSRKINGQPLTSDITIAGGVTSVNGQTGDVTLGASDVGAYGAAAGASLQTQVTTIGAHLNAEDARFGVTNYNSVAHMPEAYVEIKLPDNSWSRIWSEMTRWNWLTGTYLPGNFYTQTAIDTKLAEKADRAWGFYDSTTGAFAPDDYTWISSPKIAIAANLAYQRTVTAEGAIWVLESNGTVTETGGMTNGFFRISDDEGNSLFEIVKGNKRTVGADAASCQTVAGFTPTKLQIGYSIVSDVHPTIYVCNSLSTQAWKAEDDSDCVANVSWSGASGAWVAQVQGKSAYSSLFVKAMYEVGGETYISNSAPVSMQYLMLGGVKYAVGTATISGHTVLTLTVAP